MFVGHYAPALLARAAVPESRLWMLFLAAQGLDVGFDLLAIAGIERVDLREGVSGPGALDLQWMPYTHSLASALLVGVACAAVGRRVGRTREGIAIGLVTAAHWFFDWLVHPPDLHLGYSAAPRLGLGLWSWPWLAHALEIALLLGSAAILANRLKRGRGRLAALVGALCLAQGVFALAPAPDAVVPVLALALTSTVAFAVAATRILPDTPPAGG